MVLFIVVVCCVTTTIEIIIDTLLNGRGKKTHMRVYVFGFKNVLFGGFSYLMYHLLFIKLMA